MIKFAFEINNSLLFCSMQYDISYKIFEFNFIIKLVKAGCKFLGNYFWSIIHLGFNFINSVRISSYSLDPAVANFEFDLTILRYWTSDNLTRISRVLCCTDCDINVCVLGVFWQSLWIADSSRLIFAQ
jgi:hypothetical protein